MIEPHGGTLINKELSKSEKEKTFNELNEFRRVKVTPETILELKNIAFGVFSPLKGFMNQNDYTSVLNKMRLENNFVWPIPITLDVSKEEIEGLKIGDKIILDNNAGTPIAIMDLEDIYDYDKKEYAQNVFGTIDKNHPGVISLFNYKDLLIGGEISLLNAPKPAFPDLDLKPVETRKLFKEKKWNKVVAFQTRNPPHLGHEFVQKFALTDADGLFINPVIGKKKTGDFLDEIIIETYNALIKEYYPKDRVMLCTFETEMRYAGPKEAIYHAIARKNFGCNYIIIGRDHAGVGNYYGPYDAHYIFDKFPDLGIEPIKFKAFSKCKKCGCVVYDKICPHPADLQINFSGTAIRDSLLAGKEPNPELWRPEVAKVIMKYKNPFVQ